jgi:hypothetical protein
MIHFVHLTKGHVTMKQHSSIHLLACLLLFSLPSLVMGQPIFQQEYSFGGALPVAVESMGNHLYAAGTATNQTAGGEDGCLMKTQPDGTLVWSKVFGGQGNERFLAMCRTQDGLLALLGTTTSFVGSGDPGNLYVLLVDSAGTIRKSRSINAGGNEIGYSIRQTADQGFILAGSSESGGVLRPYLVKLDPSLQIQWSRLYSSAGYQGQVARAAIQTSDGAYAFVGYGSPNNAPGDTELCIVVTDASGEPVANRHFYNTASGYSNLGVRGYDLIQNSAGELVAVGTLGGFYTMANQDIYSPLMMVVGLNTNVIFGRAYSHNSGNCSATSVQMAPNGGYIIGGIHGNYYAYMTKTDASGAKVWSYYFANTSYNPQGRGYSARNTPGGGFVLASSLSTGNKMRLIRTDAAGQSSCDQSPPFNGGGGSYISLPSASHVWSSSAVGADTVAVTAIVQATTINTTLVCGMVDIPSPFDVPALKLYPNPSADRVQVEVTGAERLTVTNLFGQVLVSRTLEPSVTERLQLDVADWAAGVYLIQAGSEIRKLIKE